MTKLQTRLHTEVGRFLLPEALHLVACSGGADSLALAAGLAWHVRRGALGGAIIVDHQLQPGSAEAAAQAAAECRGLGLDPVEVVSVQVGDAGGLEAAARTARYTALREAGERLGAERIFLGHTLDDQAETVLLGLSRGSGPRSIAGMPQTSEQFVRPILSMRRSHTRQICAELGLRVWDDPMNEPDSDVYSRRVQVRHRVLPVLEAVLGEHVPHALARTAEQLRADLEFLDEQAINEFARVSQQRLIAGQGVLVTLDVKALTLAPAMLHRVLRLAALAAGALSGELSSHHIGELAKLVTAYTGQKMIELPGHTIAWRRRAIVYLGTLQMQTEQGENLDE